MIAKLSNGLFLLFKKKKVEMDKHTRLRMHRKKKNLIFMSKLIGLRSPLADRISLNHRWYTPRKELVVPSSLLRAEDRP